MSPFVISILLCRFYTECFGMKLLRKRDIPEEKYSNAFLGFGPEESNFVVELTYSTLLRDILIICKFHATTSKLHKSNKSTPVILYI